MKRNVLKPNPEYITVSLGLYCNPNAISALCLITCRLDNLGITTKTRAQLQNTYKNRPQILVAFCEGAEYPCFYNQGSKFIVPLTNYLFAWKYAAHALWYKSPFILFSALFPSTCFFAKEMRDSHASRMKASFRAPLTRTGVDVENAFLS